MPAGYPDFPHHTQIAAYFDAYADHFGLRDEITFETGVEKATRGADGVWEISLDTGGVERCPSPTTSCSRRTRPSRPTSSTGSGTAR
jgi:cation diffusion facilitator CzcD-associated flavoprotein CzcO